MKENLKDLEERIRTLEEENSSLKEMLKEKPDYNNVSVSNINLLLNASYSILETNNFQVTSRNIFDACSKVIGAKAGYVALLSEDGMENELLFLEDGGINCTVDHNLPMPIRGLRAEAYKSGKVVYDNNFMKSDWIKYMPEGHMDLPNVLFAPLRIKGKTLGIMGFSNKDGDFTSSDAMIAGVFGDYASIALQNSRFVESIEQHAKDLADLNATKDKFFSIIAHDLKNPFLSIIGLSEMILEDLNEIDPEEIERFMKLINQSARQTYNLLNNLLQWARLQTGKIEYRPGDVNINELLRGVIDLFNANIINKNLRVDIYAKGEIIIKGDRLMLETILRNLISNAINYSYENGKITVSLEIIDKKMKISVSDEGVGIDKKNIKKLFKIEEGFKSPGVNQEKGTSLGLIICKDFIEQHQGSINVNSEPGKGSEFTIQIPL